MIPSGWSIKKASEICDVRDGTHDSPSYYREGVPLITSKNIKNGGISLDDVKYISPIDAEKINKRSKVDKNDIILSMIGTVGEVALIRSEPSFCIKNVALFKPSQEILPEFLLYYFQSPTFKGFIRSQLDGGIQKFLSLGSLRDLNIPVPQKREQEKIAKILSTWDEAIEKLQKKLNFLRTEQLFFLDHFLSQNEAKESVLGEYFKVKNGFAFKSSEFQESGVSLIRISNIAEGSVSRDGAFLPEEYLKKYENFQVLKGDILIAMSGATTGKFGIYQDDKPSLLNQRVGKFQATDPKIVDPRIVRYVLYHLQQKIYDIAAGGAQPNISSSGIESIPLSLPSIDKQRKICDLFDSVEHTITLSSKHLALLNKQKQGLMQQLLTGKKRVKV